MKPGGIVSDTSSPPALSSTPSGGEGARRAGEEVPAVKQPVLFGNWYELIEFRASPIHGRGGFAATEIAAGTRIIEYGGERIDKLTSRERCIRGNRAIFHLDKEWDLDGEVDENPARWLNHSCVPNCQAELKEGRIWISAQRAIRAGEEITFDYGYDLRDYRGHPCCCGAPDCVGFIVAEEWRSQVRDVTTGNPVRPFV